MLRRIAAIVFTLSSVSLARAAELPIEPKPGDILFAGVDRVIGRKLNKLPLANPDWRAMPGRNLWIDERSVIRDSFGNVVGYWGVDGPQTRLFR